MKNVIYKLTSPSGKVYIGQAKCFVIRMANYTRCLAKGQPKLYHAMKKYGWKNFQKEIIDGYHGSEVKDGLDALETYWITHYNAVFDGYNCNPVGGSRRGHKATEETRKKLSASLKGRKRPKEESEKAAASNRGKKRTIEQRMRMGESRKGKKRGNMSAEQKEKLSLAHMSFNRNRDDEQRKAASEKAKSRGISKETREKMMASRAKNALSKKLLHAATIPTC